MEEKERREGDPARSEPADPPQRPEVEALLTQLEDGIRSLRELPLVGIEPALGDRLWP